MKQKKLGQLRYVVGIVILTFATIGIGLFYSTKSQNPNVEDGALEEQLGSIEQSYDTEELANTYELVALEKDDLGLEPDTDFELKTTVETSADIIKNSLHFSPEINYIVSQKDNDTFLISPENKLTPNTILGASIQVSKENEEKEERTLSWAYQVKGSFQVISTLPRNQVTNVPLETGIEVNFSHLNVEKFEDQFSISPAASGKFEYHQKTIVFVPNDPLQPKKIYTVTIGKDVNVSGEKLNEDFVFQFETAASDKSENEEKIRSFEQMTYETSSEEPPIFVVLGPKLSEVKEIKIQIYAFKTPGQFAEAYKSFAATPHWSSYADKKWNTSTDGLTFFSSYTSSLSEVDSWRYALTTPEVLPKGYYLVQIEGENIQTLLQVSDISAFIETSKTDLIIWSHNNLSQEPISNLEVYLPDNTLVGTTDSQGILRETMPTDMENDEFRQGNLILLSKDSDTLLLPLQTYSDWYWGGRDGEEYWSYLYLDQPFYRPTDVVNFWGMVQSRYGGSVPDITVELYNVRSDQDIPLQTKTITPETYGSFDGSLNLDQLQPGGYYIILKAGEENLFTRYITILTFNKPTFELDINPKNTAVYSGSSVTHKITATFFDGTPISGLDISVGDTTVTTNEVGVAEYTNTYVHKNDRKGPDNAYISAHPTFSEEAEIVANTQVLIYPSAYTIEFDEPEISGSTASIQGAVFSTDLSKVEGENSWWSADVKEFPIKNTTAQITVTREWYTREQTGTKYNFLQKQAYPTYEYTRHEETVSESESVTDNNGSFSLDVPILSESNYTVKAVAKDTQGRSVSHSVYVNPYIFNHFGNDSHSIKISDGERINYSVGDSIPVEFLENGDSLPTGSKGDFLFIFSQQGIRSLTTSATPKISFNFTDEYIPSVDIQGIWFDGRSYWYTEEGYGMFGANRTASFDEKDRGMEINVKTDKEEYQPGEQVEMDVSTTKADGTTDATILNVNLIDEAIYHILPDQGFGYSSNYRSDFNTVLYRNISSGIISVYASHYYPKSFSGAEGGGGGDSRSDFPDKAFFKTVTTDKYGKAHISFKLPDNITSWRVNVHALSSGLYAGSTFSRLPVTKPFFVTAVVNSSYLLSDEPVIKVRCFGDALNSETPVKIKILSPSLGIEQELTTKGSEQVELTLDNLSLGHHEIEFLAQTEEYTDGIVRDIDIVDTNLRWQNIKVEEMANGWKPSTSSGSTIYVTLGDKQKGQYYPFLTRSLYNFGDRLDQQVSRILAAQMMQNYYNEEVTPEEIIPTEYQHSENGGLMLFPFADSDDSLSAQVAGTDVVKLFDIERLKAYFYGITTDPTLPLSNKTVALYGLASLKEPVLVDIYSILSASETTAEDRLFLSLALAELGDYQKSAEVFHEVESENKLEIQNDQWALKLSSSQSNWVRDSFIAANITALLQESQSDKYFNYSYQNRFRAKDLSSELLIVHYLEARLKNLPSTPTKVRYTYNGEEKDASFETEPVITFTLTPEMQKSFEILDITGKGTITSRFFETPTNETLASSSEVSVQRTYQSDLKDGKVVKVVLTYDIPNAEGNKMFQITDFLPSGLQPIIQPRAYSGFSSTRSISAYSVDGQMISFGVWPSKTKSIIYYARVVNKGTFTAEPPIIQSVKYPEMRSVGNEEIITID